MKLSLLTLFLLIAINAAAAPIALDRDFENMPIGSHIEYLADPTGRLTIDDIRGTAPRPGSGGQLRWQRCVKDSLGLGFTAKTYWVRFAVANHTGADALVYLNQNYSLISYIDCYIDDGKSVTLLRTGHGYKFSRRPLKHRTFVFPLQIKEGGTISCYLRFQTESAMIIDLDLYTPEIFKVRDDRESAILWMFIGILLIMFLYHLILLFSVKDIGYLYYILSIASMLFLSMGLTSLSFQHLWPDNPWWERYNNPLMIGLTSAFFFQFGRYYIDLRRQMPRVDIVARVLIILNLAAGLLTLIIRNFRISIVATTAITLATMFLCIYILAVLAFMKKSYSSRSFLGAASLLILGAVLYILKTYGLIPENLATNYSLQAGWTAMLILLSLGLADRINAMSRQVEETRQNYIRLIESSNDIIFNLDEKFRFATVNRAIQKLLGFDPAEVLNTGFLDYIERKDEMEGGRHPDIFEDSLSGLGRDRDSITFRCDFRTKYGTEPVTLSVKLDYVKTDGKAGIFGTASTVTDDLVMNLMDSERLVLCMDNNFGHAELLTQRLVKNLGRFLDQAGVQGVKTGLLEVIINAIEHGNLEIKFSEKTSAMVGHTYLEFVRERQKDPLYAGRKVTIEYSLSTAMVAYRITDEGKGFDHGSVMAISPDSVNRELLTHGRGLIIAKRSFDVMTFNEKGNQVLLVKYFSGATGGEARF